MSDASPYPCACKIPESGFKIDHHLMDGDGKQLIHVFVNAKGSELEVVCPTKGAEQ